MSRLRGALGAGVVLGTPAGYRLGDPPAVRVDLDEAALLLGECRARLAAARPRSPMAGRAPAPCSATTRPGRRSRADWVVDLRVEHAAQLRAARHMTAEALLRAGDTAGAEETAQAAIRVDRLDEPAHRLLMAAYQAGGEPTRALGVFERLRMTLLDELGVDPAPETRAVHQALLTGLSCRDAAAPLIASATSTAPVLAGRTAEVGLAHRHLGRGRRRAARAAPRRRRRRHRQDPAGGGACADRRGHRRTGAHRALLHR